MLRVMDLDEVFPGLAVGKEASFEEIGRAGYDVAVRCLPSDYPHTSTCEAIHCPLTDDAFEIVQGDWGRACGAAAEVVERIKGGKRVYVYCREGLNRSALVAALAVRELCVCSGASAVEMVRSHRAGALYNWHFSAALGQLGPPDGELRALEQPAVPRRL